MPGRLWVAERRERARAVGDDPGHRCERLHVADERGPTPQPAFGRIRRALVGLGASVLEGTQQDGLLADDERAAELAHRDAQWPPGHRRRVPDVPALHGRGDRGAQPLGGRHGRRTHDDDDLLGPHRPRGDGGALDDRVRIALHERAVHLGARVRLEAVRDDDATALRSARAVAPLASGRIRASAATAQPRLARRCG